MPLLRKGSEIIIILTIIKQKPNVITKPTKKKIHLQEYYRNLEKRNYVNKRNKTMRDGDREN